MSIQNKKAKYDARQTRAATNRMEQEMQEVYIEDHYFIDDIDDIEDNEVETAESSKNSIIKINIPNKKRKRATKEPTSFV
jgi:hypothetical protein